MLRIVRLGIVFSCATTNVHASEFYHVEHPLNLAVYGKFDLHATSQNLQTVQDIEVLSSRFGDGRHAILTEVGIEWLHEDKVRQKLPIPDKMIIVDGVTSSTTNPFDLEIEPGSQASTVIIRSDLTGHGGYTDVIYWFASKDGSTEFVSLPDNQWRDPGRGFARFGEHLPDVSGHVAAKNPEDWLLRWHGGDETAAVFPEVDASQLKGTHIIDGRFIKEIRVLNRKTQQWYTLRKELYENINSFTTFDATLDSKGVSIYINALFRDRDEIGRTALWRIASNGHQDGWTF